MLCCFTAMLSVVLQISPTATMPEARIFSSAFSIAANFTDGEASRFAITACTNGTSPVPAGIIFSKWLNSKWQWAFINPGHNIPSNVSTSAPASSSLVMATTVPSRSVIKMGCPATNTAPSNKREALNFLYKMNG